MANKNAGGTIKSKINGDMYTVYPNTRISNVDGLSSALSNKVDKVTGKGLSSNDYTTSEKNKLAGIAEGATANIGTVTSVKVGNTAYNPSSGVVSLPAYPTDTNTHRPIQMNGTEILGNNTTALNLKAGSNVSLSNSSGTVTIAATDTTYSAATQSTAGLMSSTDKTKLDGIATGANKYTHPSDAGNTGSFGDTTNQTPAYGATFKVPSFTVNSAGHVTAAGEHTVTIPNAPTIDSALSDSSTNAVQNKVINATITAILNALNPVDDSVQASQSKTITMPRVAWGGLCWVIIHRYDKFAPDIYAYDGRNVVPISHTIQGVTVASSSEDFKLVVTNGGNVTVNVRLSMM